MACEVLLFFTIFQIWTRLVHKGTNGGRCGSRDIQKSGSGTPWTFLTTKFTHAEGSRSNCRSGENIKFLKSIKALHYFPSALQISRQSDVKLLFNFKLAYRLLKKVVIFFSLVYFMLFFSPQSYANLEMSSDWAPRLSIEASYTTDKVGD